MEWITALVAGVTVIGNIIISLLANRKSMALIEYRLRQLEEKQDKHNNLIERQYKLEQEVSDLKQELQK